MTCLAGWGFVTEVQANGRKATTFLSFHIEAESVEEGKMVERIRLGNKDYFFRRAPEITNDQVETFYAFRSSNGRSFGAAFKLNKVGKQRLTVITEVSVGQRLLTAVNQKPINFVVIDTPIRDGVIVVWSGLTAEHIEMFDDELDRGEMNNSSPELPAGGGTPGIAGDVIAPGADTPNQPAKKERPRLFGRFRKKNPAKEAAESVNTPMSDWADENAPVPQ